MLKYEQSRHSILHLTPFRPIKSVIYPLVIAPIITPFRPIVWVRIRMNRAQKIITIMQSLKRKGLQVLISGAQNPLVPMQEPSLFCFPFPRNKLNVIDPRRKDRFINPNHPSYLGSILFSLIIQHQQQQFREALEKYKQISCPLFLFFEEGQQPFFSQKLNLLMIHDLDSTLLHVPG